MMHDKNLSQTPTESKITTIANLVESVNQWKIEGYKSVLCHGVFDLLHPGHIKHLESAKLQGERLIVTITPDHYVNKGPGRPVFDEKMRAYSLASIECVDLVAINDWKTAVETITTIEPDVYAKGNEYQNAENDVTRAIQNEIDAINSVGGYFYVTDEVTYSSSQLINQNFDIHTPETSGWLSEFRNRYSLTPIVDFLNKVKGLNILVLGEAIIDEYVYCSGLGKSSKDPILAFQTEKLETYIGGSLAVASHLSGFCNSVTVISLIGNKRNRETFIRSSLPKNIEAYFIARNNAPTIHKRRYIDTHTKAKLIEMYDMGHEATSQIIEKRVIDELEKHINKCDIIVAADYGHEFFTPQLIKLISNSGKFLAVNSQHNAGNRGFNTVTRYPKADYISMNGQELAIETRLRNTPTAEQILAISKSINCGAYTVTLGDKGTLHYSTTHGFTAAPAFAARVLDRVGSGDAVFAISTPLVFLKAPWEVIGLISNLVGAQMVSDLGNKHHLTSELITNQIKSLIK